MCDPHSRPKERDFLVIIFVDQRYVTFAALMPVGLLALRGAVRSKGKPNDVKKNILKKQVNF